MQRHELYVEASSKLSSIEALVTTNHETKEQSTRSEKMKIYGCHKKNKKGSFELSEVTIVTDPSKLRTIANFLHGAADVLETNQTIKRMRLHDFQDTESDKDPDLIVYWK